MDSNDTHGAGAVRFDTKSEDGANGPEISPEEGEHHHPEYPPKEEYHRLPPEAYTACKGKSAGDTAQLKTPHGETMNGICENHHGKLVLRPEGKHLQQRGGHRPPPSLVKVKV